MKKIVYWQRFVSTEHCTAYKSEIEECLQLIHEGNYKEVNLEKLTGTKNTYSARLSRSGRIIFTIIEEQGEQTVLLLDVLLNHEYDKCVYLNDQYLNKYLANLNSKDLFIYNPEESSFSKASSSSQSDSASASPLFQPQWQPAIKYHNQNILLDPSQQVLLTCSLPAFIEGVAGSGKTCTAFAKLIDESKKEKTAGRVLYISLSQHLIDQIQKEFKEAIQDHSTREFLFLTYEQFLSEFFIKNSNLQLVTIQHFSDWFSRRKRLGGLESLDHFSIDLLIAEARFLSGFTETIMLNHDGLQKSTESVRINFERSLFIVDDAAKDVFQSVFQEYLNHLIENNLINIELTKFSLKSLADLIIVDESQAFSGAQLHIIQQAAKNAQVMYCYDQYQNLVDGVDHLHWLIQHLQSNEISPTRINLQKGHRCKGNVANWANRCLELRKMISGKQFSKSSKANLASINNGGSVNWLNDFSSLKDKYDPADPEWAVVIGSDDFKDEAGEIFRTLNIFTEEEIRGLEFKDVILYHPFANKIFKDMQAIIRNLSKSDTHYADLDDIARHEYRIALSKLFTASTRSQENLLIISSKKDYRYIREYFDDVISNGEFTRTAKSDDSSEEKWFEIAKQRMNQSNEAIAREIIEKHCPSITFDAFMQEYSHSNSLRLADLSVGKKSAASKEELRNNSISIECNKDLRFSASQKKLTNPSEESNQASSTSPNKNIQYDDILIQNEGEDLIDIKTFFEFLTTNLVKEDDVWRIFFKKMKINKNSNIDIDFLKRMALTRLKIIESTGKDQLIKKIEKVIFNANYDRAKIVEKINSIFSANQSFFEIGYDLLLNKDLLSNKLLELVGKTEKQCSDHQLSLLMFIQLLKIFIIDGIKKGAIKKDQPFHSIQACRFLLLDFSLNNNEADLRRDFIFTNVDIGKFFHAGAPSIWQYTQSSLPDRNNKSIASLFLEQENPILDIMIISLNTLAIKENFVNLGYLDDVFQEKLKSDLNWSFSNPRKDTLLKAYLNVKYKYLYPLDENIPLSQKEIKRIKKKCTTTLHDMIFNAFFYSDPLLCSQKRFLEEIYKYTAINSSFFKSIDDADWTTTPLRQYSEAMRLQNSFTEVVTLPWPIAWIIYVLNDRELWPLAHAILFYPHSAFIKIVENVLASMNSKQIMLFLQDQRFIDYFNEFLIIEDTESEYGPYDSSLIFEFRTKCILILKQHGYVHLLLQIGNQIFREKKEDIINVYKLVCRNLDTDLLNFIAENPDILNKKMISDDLLTVFYFLKDWTRNDFFEKLFALNIDFLQKSIRETIFKFLFQHEEESLRMQANRILDNDQSLDLNIEILDSLYEEDKEKFYIEFKRIVIQNICAEKKDRLIPHIIRFMIKNNIVNECDLLSHVISNRQEDFKWFMENIESYISADCLSKVLVEPYSVSLKSSMKQVVNEFILSDDDTYNQKNISFLVDFVKLYFTEEVNDLFEIPSNISYEDWEKIIKRFVVKIGSEPFCFFIKFYENETLRNSFNMLLNCCRKNMCAEELNYHLSLTDDLGESIIHKIVHARDLINLLHISANYSLGDISFGNTASLSPIDLVVKKINEVIDNESFDLIKSDYQELIKIKDQQEDLVKMIAVIDALSNNTSHIIDADKFPVLTNFARFMLHECGFYLSGKKEILTEAEAKLAHPAYIIKYLEIYADILESPRESILVSMKRLRLIDLKSEQKDLLTSVFINCCNEELYKAFLKILKQDSQFRDRYINYFFDGFMIAMEKNSESFILDPNLLISLYNFSRSESLKESYFNWIFNNIDKQMTLEDKLSFFTNKMMQQTIHKYYIGNDNFKIAFLNTLKQVVSRELFSIPNLKEFVELIKNPGYQNCLMSHFINSNGSLVFANQHMLKLILIDFFKIRKYIYASFALEIYRQFLIQSSILNDLELKSMLYGGVGIESIEPLPENTPLEISDMRKRIVAVKALGRIEDSPDLKELALVHRQRGIAHDTNESGIAYIGDVYQGFKKKDFFKEAILMSNAGSDGVGEKANLIEELKTTDVADSSQRKSKKKNKK